MSSISTLQHIFGMIFSFRRKDSTAANKYYQESGCGLIEENYPKNANSLQAERKMSELPCYLPLPNTGAVMLILTQQN